MAATLDLKSKEEKDAELDKRIEALRRKNEALVRRYQEIEEDRKKAELEGVAVTAPRKGRLVEKENVAVEMEASLGPSRRSPRPPGPSKGSRPSPQRGGQAGAGRAARSWEESPGEQPRGGASSRGRRGRGRGAPHLDGSGDAPATATADRKSKEWEERRRQNIEKMNEEMEKIAEYERNQREGVQEPNPVRNFLDDPRRRGGPLEESERDRRGGSRRHGRNWGGPDFERVRSGLEQERQGRRAGLGGAGDMTLAMTGRERLEYLRWKQEREKIDQERLQRHRKPTGQWRREWDAEKTEGMFKDGPASVLEPSAGSDDQPWVRPPKPPTFGEFLSQHKAEVNNRRRRKNSRPPAKAAPRAYSDHDDRWEQTKETAAPSPEPPQPIPPKEPHTQASEGPAPTHLPPEDEGEEDEEWEDISGEESEEELEEEEEEGAEEAEEEEEPAPDQPQEAAGHPVSEPTETPTPAQAPASPTSPFSPDGGHQPVSDWGEEMELNSPRTAHPAGASSPGGDQLAPASPDTGPSLPGSQPAEEEEGSEAAPEAGPEPQETAEITDLQRASSNV
ncbi:coiled-coil domain-containing protein 9 isoform X1 [Echinops telfairi]|uniref:Coiled-coil domain-containing protein 9 isoform X1 n=1 Tax=Echinops telfairi TaxID=9371 RepID=A0AC55DAZ7_ECHTE|nr:coiled-coil domain-containing protein 9 isoform X1 [Echinops telfairi]